MDERGRRRLPPETVVVRGGAMEDQTMSDNVEVHEVKHGEWALSVVAAADRSHAELVGDSRHIRQRYYHHGTVADLEALGYVVVEDRSPHALVLLGDRRPDAETWEAVRKGISNREPNPHYEDRARSYGKR